MYINNISTTLGIGYGVGTPIKGSKQIKNWPSQYPNPGYYLLQCHALKEWNSDSDPAAPGGHDCRWPIQELVHVVSINNHIATLEEPILYDHPQYSNGYLTFMVINPLVNITVKNEQHTNALFQYIYRLTIDGCVFSGDPIPCNIIGCRNVKITNSTAIGTLPFPYPHSSTTPWNGWGIPTQSGHGYLFAPQNCSNVLMENCISRNGRYGVSIFGGTQIQITNHQCYNTVTDIDMHGNYAMDIEIDYLLSGGVYPPPQNEAHGPLIKLGNETWPGAPVRVNIGKILQNAQGDTAKVYTVGMPWTVFPSTALPNIPTAIAN